MKISSSLTRGVLLAACGIFLAGCNEELLRQDMANQPKNKPLSESDFFADGRSERPLIENTVARGSIGQQHPKLRELSHRDFTDFAPIEGELKGYDACFFCLGASSAGMNPSSSSSPTPPPSRSTFLNP